jgi:hypothetical protein
LVLTRSSVLAQAQLAQAVFLVRAVVLVLLVVDMEADLPPVVDLLVDPVLLLATSAVDQTEDLSTLLARLATNAENPAICKDSLLTISVTALLT